MNVLQVSDIRILLFLCLYFPISSLHLFFVWLYLYNNFGFYASLLLLNKLFVGDTTFVNTIYELLFTLLVDFICFGFGFYFEIR